MEEKVEAIVYAPTRRPRPRKGRGFSIKEIGEAGLTLYEAKRLEVPVDKRRGTSHPQNVQLLKENYGAAVPLTEIKGIGKASEEKLAKAGILDAYDLAHADLNDLSKKVPYSKKSLQKWQAEAKRLLKK